MSDFRAMIAGEAFRVVPGAVYNETREELHDGSTMFYEVVLPAEGNWESFRDRAYPPFVRYLRNKRFSPEHPRGVVVSAFLLDLCYLLEGQVFLDICRKIEGLGPAAFRFRIHRWLAE